MVKIKLIKINGPNLNILMDISRKNFILVHVFATVPLFRNKKLTKNCPWDGQKPNFVSAISKHVFVPHIHVSFALEQQPNIT
jgi:hypothetical protein